MFTYGGISGLESSFFFCFNSPFCIGFTYTGLYVRNWGGFKKERFQEAFL